MRKFSGVTVAATAMAVLLAGWASGGRAESGASLAPAPAGTLTMAIPTDPGNLDPHLTLLGAARTVGSFTYDNLVNVVRSGEARDRARDGWKATPRSGSS